MLNLRQGFAWSIALGLFLACIILEPSHSATREGSLVYKDIVLYFFANGGKSPTTNTKPAGQLETGKIYSGPDLLELLKKPKKSGDGSLFQDAELGVFLSDLDNSQSQSELLAICKRMDFQTAEETNKQKVLCDGAVYTYTFSEGSIIVVRDGQPEIEFPLLPGYYRLNDTEFRIQ